MTWLSGISCSSFEELRFWGSTLTCKFLHILAHSYDNSCLLEQFLWHRQQHFYLFPLCLEVAVRDTHGTVIARSTKPARNVHAAAADCVPRVRRWHHTRRTSLVCWGLVCCYAFKCQILYPKSWLSQDKQILMYTLPPPNDLRLVNKTCWQPIAEQKRGRWSFGSWAWRWRRTTRREREERGEMRRRG